MAADAVDEVQLRDLIPGVLAALVHRGADFATAEDAVQEALIRALETWPSRRPDDPKGWLITTAWRRFLDLTRSDIARRDREIRVFQDDAYLSLDYGAQTGEIYRKTLLGIARDEVAIEKGEPLRRELQSFLECAATGRRPAVSGQEAADALDLALRITALIESGGGGATLGPLAGA